MTGARFTPLGGFGSIYLAPDAVTALREVSAVFGERTIRTPPWTVFAVEGFLQRVLDLTDPNVQSQLGTSLSELTGDWVLSQDLHREGKEPLPPTQALAKVAYDMGTITAIQYRSAKNIKTGINLVVFADRLALGEPSFLNVYDPSGLLKQRLP
jgi:RES domain